MVNKLNQKSYIGQTSRKLEVRLQEHQSSKSGCIKLRHAINKYGINNFDIDILSIAENLPSANFLERFYIKLFNSIDRGYNLKEGGSNGKPSNETRKLMSEQHMGDKNVMFGKHHTQIVKDTISIKKQGCLGYWKDKSLPRETRDKISTSRKGLTVGENNPGAKLTLVQVETIKLLLQNTKLSHKDIGKQFGVSKATIQRISAGTHWK